MSDPVVFPEPPAAGAVEWPGTMIGLSNIVTRTRSERGGVGTIDGEPGKYDLLMGCVRRKMGGRELFIHDSAIHGIRVRLHTNSRHLIDFWKQNWFGVEEWEAVTGLRPTEEPGVRVYAFGDIGEQPEAAFYSRKHDTVILFNNSYYGQVKARVLEALGWILAGKGIHLIRGAAVERNGRGVLCIGEGGSGKSTIAFGMMDLDGTRFHSDDGVIVRYTFPRRGGEPVSPQSIRTPDGPVKGYRCYRWLKEHPERKDIPVSVMSLENEQFEIPAGELDLSRPEAHAFVTEKAAYLRADLVRSFPRYVSAFLESRLENVPDVSRGLLEREKERIAGLVRAALEGPNGRRLRMPEVLGETILRLCAADSARAMLRTEGVFGKERCFTNPMEPLRLAAVVLLRRTEDDPTALRSLSLEEFAGRLMLGRTRKGKVACGAYRGVDEPEEAAGTGGLYARHEDRRRAGEPIPESLLAELELFRQLHGCAGVYDVNTFPRLGSGGDAVSATIRLIARTLESLPGNVSLGPDRVEEYIEGCTP